MLNVLDNGQLQRIAPSIFAHHAYQDVSERYTFIPTANILDAMRANGFEAVDATQSRCRIEGKRDFTKHMVKFMRVQDIDIIRGHKAARPGQHHFFESHGEIAPEFPQICLVNSHDRTSGFSLLSGLYRLACSNGLLICASEFEAIRVRHSGNIADDVLEGAYRIVEEMPKVAEHVHAMKALTLDKGEQVAFARAALELRYPTDDNGNTTAPMAAEKLLTVRRAEDSASGAYNFQPKTDLWTTFNVTQENLIKGGLRGVGSTGRRMHTRAVKAVSEDIRLNKALWTLAENMRALKAA